MRSSAMLAHASYAYPTHWLLVVEVGLVLLALLVVWLRPQTGRQAVGALWRRLRSWRPPAARLALTVGVASGLAHAATLALMGPPVPRVVDEWSYLLAADTFAEGRLSNPTPPAWRHFEALHVLQHPTTASKYPPGQGLVLALGQVLGGDPAVGLVLSAGLLGWALCLMLSAWLPPPWPLLGAAFAVLRLGIGGYWNQSYWGGSVAAVGGALVLAGVAGRGRHVAGLQLGAGAVILAISRPYEGLALFVPAAAGLLLTARRRSWLPRQGLTAGAVLLLGAVGMLAYNRQVTGDPWLFPHAAYTEAWKATECLHFQWCHGDDWVSAIAVGGALRLAYTLYLTLGPFLALLIALAAPRLFVERRMAVPLACGLSVVVAQALTWRWWHHYSAPATGVLLLLALQAARHLRAAARRRPAAVRVFVLSAVAAQVAWVAVQLPAHRPDAGDWSRQRQRIEVELRQRPGRDLVFVETGEGHRDPWVQNRARLESADVVWAWDLGPAANRRLAEDLPGRRTWKLATGTGGRLQPEPYDLQAAGGR